MDPPRVSCALWLMSFCPRCESHWLSTRSESQRWVRAPTRAKLYMSNATMYARTDEIGCDSKNISGRLQTQDQIGGRSVGRWAPRFWRDACVGCGGSGHTASRQDAACVSAHPGDAARSRRLRFRGQLERDWPRERCAGSAKGLCVAFGLRRLARLWPL